MIDILIVDDHELVRTGIKRLLSEIKGVRVVGEAVSGEDAVNLARKLHPNVVIMDMRMPGIGGLEATRKLKLIDPDLKVLVLTACGSEPFPSRLFQAGASGYLTKDSGIDELVHAIRAVHAGQRYISPEVAQELALKQINPEADSPEKTLSQRELQIMLMITSGQSVQEISEKLFINTKTVNGHRYNIFKKLGINNDVDLTHLAIRYGMLNTDELVGDGSKE